MPVLTALKKAEHRRRQRDENDSSDEEIDNIKINVNSDDEEEELTVQQKLAKKKAEILAASKKGGSPAAAAAAAVPSNSANRKQQQAKKQKEQEDDEEENDDVSDDEDEEEQEEENQQQTVKFVEPNNWVERMSLVALKPLPDDIDPEDDPRREEAFVQHALLSVQRGVEMLDKAKIPWRRPDDYYAEMYKSDVHMDKIRRAIESTKTAVQERMKRRMIKEQKQYGKQVQADVLRQRAQEKRSMLAKVNELRKRKTRGGNDQSGDKLDELFDDDEEKGGRGGNQHSGNRRSRHSARGAAFRDKKNNNLRPGGRSSGGGRGAGKKGGGRPGKSKRR